MVGPHWTRETWNIGKAATARVVVHGKGADSVAGYPFISDVKHVKIQSWGIRRTINLVDIYLALSFVLSSLNMETLNGLNSQPTSSTGTGARGRGHPRSRRRIEHTHARGLGYRRGPAPRYQERLTPDGVQSEQLDEAEATELEARYASRNIGTNADRYEEPEPEIGPDGMNSIEPHIVNIMRWNLSDRSTNPRTRGRPQCVSRAATHGGSDWIFLCPCHCG